MKGFQAGDPRAVSAGARGGLVSGARRFERVLARVRALWPEMPAAAAPVIYAYGEARFRSGLQRRCRLARRQQAA